MLEFELTGETGTYLGEHMWVSLQTTEPSRRLLQDLDNVDSVSTDIEASDEETLENLISEESKDTD